MKTFAGLGLLFLLLAHSMGWPVAVLLGGKVVDVPRRDQHFQPAASAWHTFAQLSERMQEMQLAKMPPTPLGSVLKMMGDLAKSYLPGTAAPCGWGRYHLPLQTQMLFAEPLSLPTSGTVTLATPPPEIIG